MRTGMAMALGLTWVLCAALGCGRERQTSSAQTSQSGAAVATSASGRADPEDPCTLVSRAEAERYLGPLYHDPFRVTGGDPAPDGRSCRYEAQNGRHIVIEPTFTDGKMAMKVAGMMGRLVEKAIVSDTGQTDTLDVHWDEARILVPGELMARKGDAMVQVSYQGSGAGDAGGAMFADIALSHMDRRWAYDGAAAARNVRWPRVAPRDACTLVERADAEKILGPLAGDPKSSSNGTACTYTLRERRGILAGQNVELVVQWRDGWASLDGSKQMMATVVQNVAPGGLAQARTGETPGAGALPGISQMAKDSDFAKLMHGMRGLMQSQGVGVEVNDAGELKQDTAVAGPWDKGVMDGTSFVAVKTDVQMAIGLRAIRYEQARALIAKAMEKL